MSVDERAMALALHRLSRNKDLVKKLADQPSLKRCTKQVKATTQNEQSPPSRRSNGGIWVPLPSPFGACTHLIRVRRWSGWAEAFRRRTGRSPYNGNADWALPIPNGAPKADFSKQFATRSDTKRGRERVR